MSIVRTALAFERFTAIPNEWARDQRISRRARGLLLELMSHRQGWRITVDSLVEGGPEGKDAVRSGLNELVKAGYLTRAQRRAEGGTFGEADWQLHDPFEDTPPSADSPQTADPAPKKTTPKKKNPPKPPEGADAQAFEEFYAAYPRHVGKEAARRAFARAAKKHGAAVILEGGRRFANDPNLPPAQYVPHPSTWLNRGSWSDDPLPERSDPDTPRPSGDDVPPEQRADAWMYLGSGEPRKSYADYADPGAPTA